jgi:hypothetical protein
MPWNKDDPLERAAAEDGRRETKRANQAFRDYARLGSARSLEKLFEIYIGLISDSYQIPATKSLATLRYYCHTFSWVERANRFDVIQEEKDKAAYEARRKQLMEAGLALAHERIGELETIYERLKKDFQVDANLWLPDRKGIGSAENFETVDIVRFNAPIVDQMRGTLDDIAKEVGGRINKTDITSKGKELVNLTDKTDEQLRSSLTDLAAILVANAGGEVVQPGNGDAAPDDSGSET